MNARYTAVIFLSCSIFGVVVNSASQSLGNNGANPSAAPAKVIHSKPTNLKVLPKDTSADEIAKLMHRYREDLGVPCAYCHEENPQTKQLDFASDENPMKETARLMIKMNDEINTKYLAQLGDRRYAEPFTCGSCHQGQVEPPAFEPKPQK